MKHICETIDSGFPPYYNGNQKKEKQEKQNLLTSSVAKIVTPFQYNSSPKKRRPVKPVFAFLLLMRK